MSEREEPISQENSSLHSLRVENSAQQQPRNSSFFIVRPSATHFSVLNNSQVQEKNPASKVKFEQRDQEESVQTNGGRKKSHKKSEVSTFIMKTYRIIEDQRNREIIHWTDEGNCFIVKNKDLFESQILPKHFKHSKFSSFVRQLNMYDFHKIRKEKEIPIFKHKFFKMGCPELLHRIKRKSADDAKEADEDQQFLGLQSGGMLPSIADFSERPATSMKSKAQLPYHPSGHYLSQNNASAGHLSEEQRLIAENQQLSKNISELTQQLTQIELEKENKKQKIVKVLSVLEYFSLENENGKIKEESPENLKQKSSLRTLQNHITSNQEPKSFSSYRSDLFEICSFFWQNLERIQQKQG